MKKCPHCAEEIQVEATKCKHCKTIITPETSKLKIKINSVIIVIVAGMILLAGGVYAYKTYYSLNKDKNTVITENSSPTIVDNLEATTTTSTEEIEIAEKIDTGISNLEITPQKEQTSENITQNDIGEINITTAEIEYGQSMLEYVGQAIENAKTLTEYCPATKEEKQGFSDDIFDKIGMAMALTLDAYNKASKLTPPNDTLSLVHTHALSGLDYYIKASNACLGISQAKDDAERSKQVSDFFYYISQGQKTSQDTTTLLTAYALTNL